MAALGQMWPGGADFRACGFLVNVERMSPPCRKIAKTRGVPGHIPTTDAIAMLRERARARGGWLGEPRPRTVGTQLNPIAHSSRRGEQMAHVWRLVVLSCCFVYRQLIGFVSVVDQADPELDAFEVGNQTKGVGE
eukprot:g6891.t1